MKRSEECGMKNLEHRLMKTRFGQVKCKDENSILKGNLGCTTISISNKSFLNLCLHQYLKFDNSLYIVHAKRFVLITEFPTGSHLEMWRVCIVVPVSTLDKNNSNERVGTPALECNYITFQDGGPQEIQWSKQITYLYIERNMKFELLMLIQVEENSYSRLILLDSWGSLSGSDGAVGGREKASR